MSMINMSSELSNDCPSILFDLDGTLVDNVPVLVACVQSAVAKVLGRRVRATEVRQHVGRSLEAYLRSLLPTFGVDIDTRLNDLREEYEHQYSLNMKNVSAFSGITSCLDVLLHRCGLGVVTSRVNRVLEDLSRTGLAKYFDETITGQDTAERKPDPQPLFLAAQRLGALAANCIYVGDTTTDVQAAQAAGMRCIAVTYGVHTVSDFEAVRPNHLVSSPLQLKDVASRLLVTVGCSQS